MYSAMSFFIFNLCSWCRSVLTPADVALKRHSLMAYMLHALLRGFQVVVRAQAL